MKSEIFHGLRVVFIAVPHQAFAAINVLKEMEGRFASVKIPNWSPEELSNIAHLGFPRLNLSPEEDLIDEFAKEASGSPLLMQRFCLRLCLELGHKNRVRNLIDIQAMQELRREIYTSVAEQFGLPAYNKLMIGPQSRRNRLPRRLRLSSEKVDIYQCLLYAIAKSGPKESIHYTEIRSILQEILIDEDVPGKNQITNALAHMSKIARDKIDGGPVIVWQDDHVHLTDPFLMFFLRWVIRPKISTDVKISLAELMTLFAGPVKFSATGALVALGRKIRDK